jgi:hypothetical protein
MFADMEARAMNKKFHLPATMALCGAWVWALYSGRVADDPRFGVPVLLILGAATLAAVRTVHSRRVGLGTAAQMMCAMTLALMMFMVWGQAIVSFPMITLSDSLPDAVRLSPLFFTGPLVTVITALLFAYPLAVLLPRLHWLVPVLAAVLVGLVQYDIMFDPAGRLLTRAVMSLELVSLAILGPVVVGYFGRRMRGKAISLVTAG